MSPRLLPTDVHAPQTAQEVGLRYRNEEYIASAIFPPVRVTKQRNYIPVWGASTWYRDEAGLISAGGRAPMSAPDVSLSLEYRCEPIGFSVPLSVESEADFNLRLVALELCTDKVLLARERRVAALVEEPTNWKSSVTLAGVTQWSETETSTPVADIRAGLQAVSDRGLVPNTIACGEQVWEVLRDHPDISPLLNGSDLEPTERLARFFGVTQFLVGRARYTTDPEGTPEDDVTYTPVWGKNCFIGRVNLRSATADLLLPSCGYSFVVGGAIQTRVFVRKAEMDEAAEAKSIEGELVTSAASGYLIADAVA